MTESAPYTPSEATTAQKRQWLKANGHQVGDRGTLSAEAERVYAEAHANHEQQV